MPGGEFLQKEDVVTDEIVRLPDNFIGKDDQARLESFGAYLIVHGLATRWHWTRRRGIDVAFDIFRGGADETRMFSIERSRARDAFLVRDDAGNALERGKLDHIMAFINQRVRGPGPEGLA